MTVACPACRARFHIDQQRLGGKRITLRCVKCREVFKVDVPASASQPRLKVLVAHGDPSLCETVRDILQREGIACSSCHDGEGILGRLEKEKPQVALLDVGLPGSYVFDLIEEVRRHPSLREMRIILLSAVYKKTAYKRTPTSLYGADDYIEKHHLPDDLVPKIYRLTGGSDRPEPDRAQEKVVPGEPLKAAESGSLAGLCQEKNTEIEAAEAREVAAGSDQERTLRIARMIAADIALYHQDRVEEGIRRGNLFELLAQEIAEGERILDERLAAGGEGKGLVRQALAELLDRRGEPKRQTGGK